MTTVFDQTNKTLTESVAETMTSHKVYVTCNVGILPLEWPIKPDGSKSVDVDNQVWNGQKMVTVSKERFRNIDTRTVNDQGVGAQSQGYMALDLLNNSHPLESDAKFFERIKDWIKNSNDPNIVRCGVSVDDTNPYPMPFGQWDKLTPSAVLETVAVGYLGDDHDVNLQTLRDFAGYELNRKIEVKDERGNLIETLGPRQEVLNGLDILANAAGVEEDDNLVIDSSFD